MTDKELEQLLLRVERDDPAALYDYAVYLSDTNSDEALKYVLLSAQLGYPKAIEKKGDLFLEAGDAESAARCFKTGAKAGLLDCSVKLAVLRLDDFEHAAVRELEDLAEIGVTSACSALADYYHKHGNRKQAAYWRSLLK